MEINKICVVCGGRLIVGDDSKWEQNEKGEWFCSQCQIKRNVMVSEAIKTKKEWAERRRKIK